MQHVVATTIWEHNVKKTFHTHGLSTRKIICIGRQVLDLTSPIINNQAWLLVNFGNRTENKRTIFKPNIGRLWKLNRLTVGQKAANSSSLSLASPEAAPWIGLRRTAEQNDKHTDNKWLLYPLEAAFKDDQLHKYTQYTWQVVLEITIGMQRQIITKSISAQI